MFATRNRKGYFTREVRLRLSTKGTQENMMSLKLLEGTVWGILLAAIAGGCNAPKDNLEKFNGLYRQDCVAGGGSSEATAFAASKINNNDKPKGEDLLWALQLGSLARIDKDYSQSVKYFDQAEQMLNFFDYQNEALDSAASVAVNENIVPYVGEEYDGIMLNTYKGLSFMSLGEDELARVEFNRALDRQRRAKEVFAKEVQKLKEELNEKEKKGKSNVKKSVENPKVKELIKQKYPGLYEFEAYPDFVNPFTTYIAGVFFNLVGDHYKAVDLMKESYGMVSNNKYIGEDLVATEEVLEGRAELIETVWVIFENGTGPRKDEFRVDLPLFIVTNKVKYVGIALPKLLPGERAYSYLTVKTDCGEYRTKLVADIGRVIKTEFEKDFQAIITRAIISAAAKASAQYIFEKQNNQAGQLLSIGMAAYSFVTTAADVRIWSTLPKDFQVARLPMPKDDVVEVIPPGRDGFEVEIEDCNNAIVYVKIPFTSARPVITVIEY